MAPEPVPQATRDFFAAGRPTTANATCNFDPLTVAADAAGTRVIVHARYPALVEDFLAFKRARGSARERALYAGPWTWRDQVARLLAKRPLAFLNSSDDTLRRDGTRVDGDAARAWDRVGADDEGPELLLRDYLSYDEMLLGSLLGVSGPSHFVNDGARQNCGRPGAPGSFEPRGLVVGLVGARFERPGHMDCLLVRSSGRLPAPLRLAYARFLGCDLPGEATINHFDLDVYEARMRVTAELLLAEAADRARAADTTAHVYVVGLGLGVWKVDDRQDDAYASAFARALGGLAPAACAHLGLVEFAWLDSFSVDARRALEAAGRHAGLDIVFSRRNPAAKLPKPDLKEKQNRRLLVLSYAWDGNAFPGNEYWMGMVAASGDPAAACMSTISELHNPLLNPGYLDRIAVLGPWGGAL